MVLYFNVLCSVFCVQFSVFEEFEEFEEFEKFEV